MLDGPFSLVNVLSKLTYNVFGISSMSMPVQQWGQLQLQPGQQQFNGQQQSMMGYPMQQGGCRSFT